jgi:hypothetical protein
MPSTSPGRSRPTSSAFDSLEQEAYLQLWRTYDRLREIDERVFQRHGITAQQYNALRILKSVRPGTLSTTAAGIAVVDRLAADVKRLGKDQLGHLDRTTLRTLIDILAQARGPHEDPAAVAAWPGSRQPKRRVES